MNDSRKAGALILNNLSMFNEATLLFANEVEIKVFEKIKEEIEQWCQESDWAGEGDWYADDLWVCPSTWKRATDNDSEVKAYFSFDYEKGDTVDQYALASICGCGQDRVGFWFLPNFSYFGKKAEWIKFCNGSLQTDNSQLQKLGFIYEKGYWFLPVTLSSTELAIAYEGDDYDDALHPLMDALGQLKRAQEIFDRIITAAELKFGIKVASQLNTSDQSLERKLQV